MITTEVLLPAFIGPVIELSTPLGEIDLHNFADFERLIYTSDGTLHLEWIAYEPDKFYLGNQLIKRANLVLHQVSRLGITPRDPQIPSIEDRTMEHLIVEETDETSCHIRFVFAGGVEIDVDFESASLSVEEALH